MSLNRTAWILILSQQTVDFHFQLMARCLSPTSVPFLACGGSGRPRCHLAARCHVWADADPGPPSPGLLPLHGGAPTGLGCGPWWGEAEEGGGVLATDSSTLAVLRSAAEGKSCAFEVGTSESLFTQAGEGGGAGLLHKNACVMTGAAERRNALHNPNTVEAGPRLRWQPSLPIYFSSLSTQSPALSVVHSIPGKMKNGLCFYLWLQIYPYLPAEYLRPVRMKSKTVNYFTSVIRLFRENSKSRRARPCPSDAVQLFLICSWWFAGVALYIPCLWPGEGSALSENVFIFCNAALPFIRAAQDCCICVTRLFPAPSVLAEVAGFYSTICFDSPRCQTF